MLGLAHGRLLPSSRDQLHKLTMANLSQHVPELKLLGFSVVSHAVRSDTKAAIAELQARSDALVRSPYLPLPVFCG